MGAAFEKIIPIVLVFAFGYLLKAGKVLDKNDGDTLLKVFFNVSVPALIFLSVSQMHLTLELLWLPVIAILIILISYFAAHSCGRGLKLERPAFGSFLVSVLVMNVAFSYPFLLATGGEEGLALVSLFDFGNTFIVWTFTYFLACKYGPHSASTAVMLKKFASSPPLLSLFCALIMNQSHLALPDLIVQFFKMLGHLSTPLMMLSLGIFFRPKTSQKGAVFSAVFLRMGGGLLLGYLLSYLAGLEGLPRVVVLVASCSPAGITSLVFTAMEDLDQELAAGIISYSVLAGLVLVPILLQLTPR
jgi:malate permease and related proteins